MPFNFKKMIPLLGMAASTLFPNQTISNLPANSWYAVPNSRMQTVAPASGQFAGTWGVMGPSAVILAWGGGAFDSKRGRMILWGGGHADYYGNELYAFDVNSLAWTRITDPYVNPVMDQEVNGDGTPNSRHTYGGLAYVEHADRFFGIGGALAGVGFAPCYRTWVYDFDNTQWTNRAPSANPTVGADCYAAYDPESKRIWWAGGGSWGGLWSYNYDANTWTKHNDDNTIGKALAVDTKRGLLFSVGDGGSATGGVIVYDIRGKNYTRQVWATTGGNAFIAKVAVGLAYDPVSDRIVGWDGGGVYALNCDTKAWTVYNASGEPTPPSQGTYGRWRYLPGDNAFISVNGIDQNVYFFKLSAGAGTTALSPAGSKVPSAMTVFPNPYRGKGPLSFAFPNGRGGGTVRLFDACGKEIAAARAGQNGPAQLRESAVGSLPAGVYVMEWRNGKSVLAKKPVVVLK